MALSSLSVVGNANRLRRHRVEPLPPAEAVMIEPRVETGIDGSQPGGQPLTAQRSNRSNQTVENQP
jgi:Cu+-exporting ATPase